MISTRIRTGISLLDLMVGLMFVLLEANGFAADPIHRRIIVETAYYYEEVVYEVPQRIATDSKERGALSRRTPEDAARAVFLSMQELNFELWLSTWDEKTRQEILEEAKKPQDALKTALIWRSKEEWIEAWKRIVQPNTVYLTRRATTPDFVLLAFEIRSSQNAPGKELGSDVIMTDHIVFKKVGDQWLQTREFSNHPVNLLWRSGNPVLRQIGSYKNPPVEQSGTPK